MDSINSVSLSGRIVRDADIKATKNGSTLAIFTIAVTESHKTQSGEYEDYASFIDCVGYGRLYESIGDCLVKGTEVCVQGTLHQSRWKGESGNRSKVEVRLGYGSHIRIISNEKGSGHTALEHDEYPDGSIYANIPF